MFKLIKYLFLLVIIFLAYKFYSKQDLTNLADLTKNIPRLFLNYQTPKTFEIVTIDKNFNLSTSTAVLQAKAVAEAWNKSVGKEVLKYDAGGEIKIRFIFDKRQRDTIKNKIIAENIRVKEAELKNDGKIISDLKANYNNKNIAFEIENKKYQTNLDSYNYKVRAINNSGGATVQQAQVLEQEKASLDQQKNNLQVLINELNSLKSEINQNVSTHNSEVNSVNTIVNSYNSNTGGEFEKGLYSSYGTIDIYEYEDFNSLKRVLAHELGHALGLDHLKQKNSIMHYIDDGVGFTITKADSEALKKVCGIK